MQVGTGNELVEENTNSETGMVDNDIEDTGSQEVQNS
jgi:hypothetical protein